MQGKWNSNDDDGDDDDAVVKTKKKLNGPLSLAAEILDETYMSMVAALLSRLAEDKVKAVFILVNRDLQWKCQSMRFVLCS